MRLFFDANIMTYIGIFEAYLVDESSIELEGACNLWERLHGAPPPPQMLREIGALAQLYVLDEAAHFDWLCSDLAIAEVMAIRQTLKRGHHYSLLDRLIEHRGVVYIEDGIEIVAAEIFSMRDHYFPDLPTRMWRDAEQCCEAVLVESEYFLTNDGPLIARAGKSELPITVCRVSELPLWRHGVKV
jgi:hypothetical protein